MTHHPIQDRLTAGIEGPPAFAEPLHVGRPNVGDKQLFLSLVDEMFENQWLTNNGPLAQRFEDQLAAFLGVKHCVAVNNGTIGLEIAIRALGLRGEVIVPSYTFIATAHALMWQGIRPVFVDIDPVTQTLDPVAVRRAITPRTTGILAVHLWGRSADVETLQAIADDHHLELLFDAAHAFGCSRNGRMIGGFGRAEVFSFHATKFFNSFEGGAITTNDGELAELIRRTRNFGFVKNDTVESIGTNGKLTEICAAMGLTNLASIDDTIMINRRNYLSYREGLDDLQGINVITYDDSERNNFQYIVLEVDESFPVSRDELLRALQAKNVLARKYFWPGCHRMQPYADLYPNANAGLPQTERAAAGVIVLPTGTSVNPESIAVIVKMVKHLASESTGR